MERESEYSLKLYLKEIAKTPLLTSEEERSLADRILRGDTSAREHMIKANLRLVVKIAQDYLYYGMPLTDLISEGNIGLMRAVERFDPEKGAKVSTYAGWWIKQAIKRALANQSKTIRLPVHMIDKIARLRRIESRLREELGREPTDEEISDETGIAESKIRKLKDTSQRPTSLDAPVNEGESTTYGDILADTSAHNPLDILAKKNIHGEMNGLLSFLNEREREIIEARFGLNGNADGQTLDELGVIFGVSRERIRQVQNEALDKMRKKMRRTEQERSAPHDKDKLIANVASIIAILRAEGKQKEIEALLNTTKYNNEKKEQILRRELVGETGKNWYECIVAVLCFFRKAQGDKNWKKTEIRWSDIETFIIANIIPSDTTEA